VSKLKFQITCTHCGLEFFPHNKGPARTAKYCSLKCYHASLLRPITETFWRFCKPAGENDCWEWHGGRMLTGYGVIGRRRGNLLAHRICWEIHYGPIPRGMLVRHTCDNPPCVNPRHLLLGTDRDNTLDKCHRMRNPSILSKDDVFRVRSLIADGNLKQRQIADIFGVSRETVNAIKHRTNWAWLT
jgi:DNA-binding XRE family transcriptional regulator